MKRLLSNRDGRLQAKSTTKQFSQKGSKLSRVQHLPQAPSALFLEANQALGPPYHIILDTNFFAHTIRARIDILNGLMDLLLAVCIPVVTQCTIAELEKLNNMLPLRLAKDERWQRITCTHSGTYADDCIVDTVMKHRCYLVGTNDKELRQRLRKLPGVPLIAVGKGKYTIERLPNALV
jgi:U3 small nucleolar RNA-associated protein 24